MIIRHSITALGLALAVAATACAGSAEEDARAQAEAITAQAASDAAETFDSINQQVEDTLEGAGVDQEAAQDLIDQALANAEELTSNALEAAEAASGDVPKPRETAEGTSSASAPSAPSTPGVNVNTADLPAAGAALTELLGGGPVSLLKISLTPTGGFSFQVRDADMPDNVDQYNWRDGQFLDPIPVQLFGGGDLDEAVFDLAAVDLTAPERLAQAGLDVGVEGAEIDVMNLSSDPFRGLVWIVPLSGTRESKALFGNLDGTVLEVV